ncbi:hypothetical protein DFP72DRAFT_51477 [Ephemerocybe angulata]|uniref:Uncharacterized protein n=1 Tax=Ephemerocybe angulata TaxID=980116 RepID=A0A8H6HFV5_9AGAR|nr:hypothetical protein DFP72DRAFT_51477 [Tulosesus angulatus]
MMLACLGGMGERTRTRVGLIGTNAQRQALAWGLPAWVRDKILVSDTYRRAPSHGSLSQSPGYSTRRFRFEEGPGVAIGLVPYVFVVVWGPRDQRQCSARASAWSQSDSAQPAPLLRGIVCDSDLGGKGVLGADRPGVVEMQGKRCAGRSRWVCRGQCRRLGLQMCNGRKRPTSPTLSGH